jgi:hypothetical protein
MTMSLPMERPGIVTLVGVVMYLQAALAAVTGAIVIATRDSASFQDATGNSANQLLTVGITEVVFAFIIGLLAFGIMNGNRLARALVGIAMVLRIGFSGYVAFTNHAAGVLTQTVVTIAVALFVLWALYWNNRSAEFFG